MKYEQWNWFSEWRKGSGVGGRRVGGGRAGTKGEEEESIILFQAVWNSVCSSKIASMLMS